MRIVCVILLCVTTSWCETTAAGPASTTEPSTREVNAPMTPAGVPALIRATGQAFDRGDYKAARERLHDILAVDPRNDYAIGVLTFLDDRKELDAEPRANAKNEVTAQADALAAFKKQVPAVKFDRVNFEDIVEFYSDVSGVTVVANYDALGKVGVTKDSLITAEFRNVTLSESLTEVLKKASGAKDQLGFTEDHGTVFISTAADLRERQRAATQPATRPD
jgi:hypothetical protein